MVSRRAWEIEEEEFLRAFYAELGPGPVAECLQRTEVAVMVRACELRRRGQRIPRAPEPRGARLKRPDRGSTGGGCG